MTGATEPIIWSSSPGLTGYAERDSFVFFSKPTENVNCEKIIASTENTCGVTTLPLEICASLSCDQPMFDLLVYPNPAVVIVFLEVRSNDPLAEDYALIGDIDIFNHAGQLVKTWHDTPRQRLVKAIADLPGGMYTLRAKVWDQIIIKPMMITH